MSATTVTYNGIPYLIPAVGDIGWGQQVSNYLIALSDGSLTLAGGNFPIQNDVNFGPNHGVKAPFFASGLTGTIPSTTGVVRLDNTEVLSWRNSTDTGNLNLYVNGNALYFNGSPVGGGGGGSPLTTKGDLYTFSTADTRLPVGINGQLLAVDSSTSTGLTWITGGAGGGSVTGFSFTNANGISGTVATPLTTPNLTLSLGAITPTSVAASGTITGSNISGTSSGTNTGDQTITLTGDVTGSGTGSFATTLATVSIAKGGTGQTTANAALNALLPTQSGNNGKFLYTDGTNTSWATAGGGGGGGSVTSVSASGTQGVTTSVSNPTSTPLITIGLGAITPTSVTATGNVTGANISGTSSGTNTGDQTISLTGDVTGSGTGTFATTLSNTGVVAGTYGSGSTAPILTVDSKGRITGISTTSLGTSLNNIQSATGSSSVNHGSYTQAWDWNSTANATFLTLQNTANTGTSTDNTFRSVTKLANGNAARFDGQNGIYSSLTKFNTKYTSTTIGNSTTSADFYVGENGGSSKVTLSASGTPYAASIGVYGSSTASSISLSSYYSKLYLDRVTNSIEMQSSDISATASTIELNSSNVTVTGSKIQFVSNTVNFGQTNLSLGSRVVANTMVSATSIIQLTYHGTPSAPGYLYVGTIVPGASFTIRSTNASDSSVVGWTILN